MRTIEILVTPTGQTTVQTKGFSGAACQEASRFLEQALGQRTQEMLTAEFFERARAAEQQHLREGS